MTDEYEHPSETAGREVKVRKLLNVVERVPISADELEAYSDEQWWALAIVAGCRRPSRKTIAQAIATERARERARADGTIRELGR